MWFSVKFLNFQKGYYISYLIIKQHNANLKYRKKNCVNSLEKIEDPLSSVHLQPAIEGIATNWATGVTVRLSEVHVETVCQQPFQAHAVKQPRFVHLGFSVQFLLSFKQGYIHWDVSVKYMMSTKVCLFCNHYKVLAFNQEL